MCMVYDAVIIGAGCAGMTCALYLARAGKSAVIIERESIGGQITRTPEIGNFPAARGISGAEFADRMYESVTELGVEIEFDEVLKITDGDIKTVTTEYGEFRCRTVVIAAGVKPRMLGLDGEERLTGHGVSYCAMCDGAFFKGADVCVVGGGNTAFTDAAFLSGICRTVYIVHHSGRFRAEKSLMEKVSRLDNVRIVTDSEIVGLMGDHALSGVRLKNVKSQEESELEVSAVFAAIGNVPSNDAYSELVELDEAGFIKAGEDCRTNAAGIFAAGDCRAKNVRQLVTAAADGAAAAHAVIKYI